MVGSCFAKLLGERVALSGGERQALDRLEERRRDVRRGAVLRRGRDERGELFVLRSGLMMSYVLLHDGSRQILRFMYPGDIIGLPGLIYRDSPEVVAALRDAVVAPFERAALSGLFEQHPRLAALIFAYTQVERVALTDRLAALGRTSAKARIAGLLLEMRDRLKVQDHGIGSTFTLGLTQEEVGDATGLTAVHVNRMLRQLEVEGLIARVGGRLTLVDEGALARAASYVNRYEGLELGWLPPAR